MIAALYILSAILVFVSGRDSIRAYVAAQLGVDTTDTFTGQTAQEVGRAVDEGYGILTTKAVFVLIVGAAILLFTLLARNGAAWARALVLVTTFLAMFPATLLLSENSALAVNEVLPGGTWFAAFAAVPLSWLVFILLFLPPINRYAKARKLTTR
jgi:hypothetical protein